MKNFVLLSLAVLALVAANQGYSIKPRIVDPEKATSGQFPFFAYLEIKKQDPRVIGSCGASLINNEWLVSAAHCLTNSTGVNVHLGEYQLNNPEPEHISIPVGLDGLHTHPEYDQLLTLHDIALIHLPTKLMLSDNIKPIDLPKSCKSSVGVDVVAIGHGRTSNKAGVSTQLNYAQLKTVPLADCAYLFPVVRVFDSFICAESDHYGYQSVCSGDSGGPLISKPDNTLIGVADFVTILGCETGAAQGFTNIYSYLSWIQKVTGLTLPQC